MISCGVVGVSEPVGVGVGFTEAAAGIMAMGGVASSDSSKVRNCRQDFTIYIFGNN